MHATTSRQIEATIFDWWILSQQDYLFVSRSGFAETANWANPFLRAAHSLAVSPANDPAASTCHWNDCFAIPQHYTGWNYC
jgi:hypothetical protein